MARHRVRAADAPAAACASPQLTTLSSAACPARCGARPCVLYASRDAGQPCAAAGECFTEQSALGASGTASDACSVATYQCLGGSTDDWSDWLASAPAAVETVYLSDVDLRGALSNVSSSRSWTRVTLRNTSLTEVPAGLATLPLRYLDLSANSISSIPDGAVFKNVSTLNLAFNAFPDLEIVLPAIVTLNLSNNPLRKIPGAVFDMKTLKTLSLRQWNLTDVTLTATQFAFLQNLETLDADLRTTTCPNGTIAQLIRPVGGAVCIPDSVATQLSLASIQQSSSHSTAIAIGVTLGAVAVALLAFLLHRCCKRKDSLNHAYAAHKDSEEAACEPEARVDSSDASSRDLLFPNLIVFRIEYDEVEIVKQLSRGSKYEAWLGRYGATDVVVKRLASYRRDPAHAHAVGEQIELVASLEHPAIVRFLGVAWMPQDALSIQAVTEFMEGGDLRTLLGSDRAASLSWKDLKSRIATDVATALAYLHTRSPPIVFRGLSSRRILLDGEYRRAKLSGFGIKTKLDMDYDETMCAGISSAVRWTAPEVLLGEDPSESADLYSLGVVLSALDTAKIPFEGAVNASGYRMSEMEIIIRVARGQLRPSFDESSPEPLVKLAQECLAFDPALRPSAATVAEGLRRMFEDDDTSGFLTADTEHTYGSSGVWLDPALLGLRLDGADIAVSDNQLSSETKTTTQTYEGTYTGASS